MVTATAKVWNAETGKVDKVVTYEARNRMEAIRWHNCNRDYMREFRIIEEKTK